MAVNNVVGTCYEDAWRFLIKEEEGELIHGSVQTIGKRINHAWVELPTGYVWEPESGEFMEKSYFYERAEPIEEHRYTVEEAAIMLARVGKHGPWTKEEREQFLKRGNPMAKTDAQRLEDEGRKIAEQLGHGVVYKGSWLPYGPSGKFYGHFFEDDAVTRSSFLASTLEEAKKALIDTRKAFGAKLPTFPEDPGEMKERKEPWQMTKEKFVEIYLERSKSMLSKEAFSRLTKEELQKEREEAIDYQKHTIRQALVAGRPVPPEVLRDYPELAAAQYKAEYESLSEKYLSDMEALGPLGSYLGRQAITDKYTAAIEALKERYKYLEGYKPTAVGGNPDTGTSIIDLRGDYDEIAHVKGGILYRKGNIVQVWWDKWGKETWTGPSEEQARENFNAMKERWSSSELKGANPIPEELDLARTLAIIDSRPKGRIIESKLREEFGDAVIDALRQGGYVVSGSAGYNPPLLVSLKGRELIQRGNPGAKEPWQMTKAEFEGWYKERFAVPDLQGHKMRVMRALEAGKPVPPEVLADYPDLQKSNPGTKYLARLDPALATRSSEQKVFDYPEEAIAYAETLKSKMLPGDVVHVREGIGFEYKVIYRYQMPLPPVSTEERSNPMAAPKTESERLSFHERIFGKGATPPLERLGRGQTLNELLPMAPGQGPPLPRAMKIRWPWSKP